MISSSLTRTFATVTQIEYTASRRSVWFSCHVHTPFVFAEGQFMMITIPDHVRSTGKPLQNPYSIASSYRLMEETQTVCFCIKQEGEGGVSDFCVNKLRIGDTILLTGPMGHMTYPGYRPSILVATGSGLSPIWSLYQYLTSCQQAVFFAYGERDETECFSFLSEIMKKKHTDDNRCVCFFSRQHTVPERAYPGRVSQLFLFLGDRPHDPSNTNIFLCGKPGMCKDMKDRFVDSGYRSQLIMYEAY